MTPGDLEELLGYYSVHRDDEMMVVGLFDPEKYKISVNLTKCPNPREYYVTLLHEFIHAWDNNDYMTEDEVECMAQELVNDKNYVGILRNTLPYSSWDY